MDDSDSQSLADAVKEAKETRELRLRRDAELSPEERLERVHELCRQLAAIEPAQPAD